MYIRDSPLPGHGLGDDALHHVGGQLTGHIAEDVALGVDHEGGREGGNAVGAEHIAGGVHDPVSYTHLDEPGSSECRS